MLGLHVSPKMNSCKWVTQSKFAPAVNTIDCLMTIPTILILSLVSCVNELSHERGNHDTNAQTGDPHSMETHPPSHSVHQQCEHLDEQHEASKHGCWQKFSVACQQALSKDLNILLCLFKLLLSCLQDSIQLLISCPGVLLCTLQQ